MDARRWRDEQRGLREAVRARRNALAADLPDVSDGLRAQGSPREQTDRPLVSVIVVCWNAAEVLGRCLDHLFAQDYANREIIVVDDGSDDATASIAESARDRGELELVRSRRNRGCPAARNLGLGHASGEIVAFVDADGFAARDWLSQVVRAFEPDRRIGGVASTVFYDDNPLVINGAGGTTNRQGWAADLSMNESYEHASIAAEALYPMGCGMAMRREALDRVGPFDDRMLNYYDDVDYGTRLWRSGYRVTIAHDAWIDHGITGGDDSPRKRLWCERHRMRVVLKHAPPARLAKWAREEVRGLRTSSRPTRMQKLRSIAWNLRHLPSVLSERRRLRGRPLAPDRHYDASWGDAFPAGMPLRLRPQPQRAGSRIDMSRIDSELQLLHGWFPAERVGGRTYRWAAANAASLVHLGAPARRLRLDFAHVPVDTGGVDLRIRAVRPQLGQATVVWQTRLAWQYIARSVENHPLELAPGDYEVCLAAVNGWSDPPREMRSLSLALSSLSFEASLPVGTDGLDMAVAGSEEQLVSGWYEPEASAGGPYRWTTRRATAVVRVTHEARSLRLKYCMPPRPIGAVDVSLSELASSRQVWTGALDWQDGDWHEVSIEVEISPGDYLLSFEAAATWSNPRREDSALAPENRTLAIAVSRLNLSPAIP